MIEETAFINRLYKSFNARNIDAVLTMVDPGVRWANGMDGGYVHGHDGIREYWTRQWSMIDPTVDPVSIAVLPSGTITVEARQIVRDLKGKVLSDETVSHLFERANGLITRFDIRAADTPTRH